MTDQDKTREQLLDELVELRQRVATLEASERRYGTIIDTETERELAKHRVMLQTTIDCLPYNFFAIGVDGRYMLQNAVSKAQQGADVVGRRPEEVCSNEHDLAIWLENNRRAFAGEKVEGEVTLSLAGEERFYYNVIVPISDGTELYGILGVNIDITERKRAEEALQKAHDELEQRVKERTAELTKANDELRLIYDQMADGIVVVDVETTKPVRANAALCRMLGYSEEEIRTVTALQVHPPEAMPKIQEFFQAVVAGRVARFDNMPFLRRDGGVLLADVVSIRILYDGRPCRISFHHDVTDRKRAEEALRRSEEGTRGFGAGAAVALENAPGQRPRTADHILRDSRRAGPVSCRCGDAVSGIRWASGEQPGRGEEGLRRSHATCSPVPR
jgi:PAS domain S-box-containing protein